MNTDDPWPDADASWSRVLKIQTKLHQWAADDPDRRFDDLYNLMCDPAVLVDAWQRVKGNRGARSTGARCWIGPVFTTLRLPLVAARRKGWVGVVPP